MKKVILATLLLGLSGLAHAEWKYQVTQDKMGRGSDEIATVVSSNTLSISPPYDGRQAATFSLRSLRGGDNEFVAAIEKGQIICEQGRCGLLIRVDDEKPFRLVGSHPKDGSPNVVVGLIGAEDLRKIKKANSILIELTIYQNGEHVLEFDSRDNPFVGKKGYALAEISEMIKNKTPPKTKKTLDYPMDTSSFIVCKKVANADDGIDEVKVVEVDNKDIFTVALYKESSLTKSTCKQGSKKMILSFFNYE